MSLQLGLYKLADAIQCPLGVTQKGKVIGGGEVVLPGDIPLRLKVVPVAYFAHEQIGVVCRIAGDLYMVFSYYAQSSTVSCFMVDAGKLGDYVDGFEVKASDTLRVVLQKLTGAIVASYYYKNGMWKALSLPK